VSRRWLSRVGLIVAIVLIAGLTVAMIGGFFDWLIYPESHAWLIGGSVVGMIFGLVVGTICAVLRIPPAERFLSNRAYPRRRAAVCGGFLIGTIVGLTMGWSNGLIPGLILGLTISLIAATVILFTSEANPGTRSVVNEGTHRSIKMAVTLGTGAAVSVLVVQPILGTIALFFAPIVGLFAGLVAGGAFVLKHAVLRSFIWASRSGPLRYVSFLARSRELLFLRQLGGGGTCSSTLCCASTSSRCRSLTRKPERPRSTE
jgi:hypothetical protein